MDYATALQEKDSQLTALECRYKTLYSSYLDYTQLVASQAPTVEKWRLSSIEAEAKLIDRDREINSLNVKLTSLRTQIKLHERSIFNYKEAEISLRRQLETAIGQHNKSESALRHQLATFADQQRARESTLRKQLETAAEQHRVTEASLRKQLEATVDASRRNQVADDSTEELKSRDLEWQTVLFHEIEEREQKLSSLDALQNRIITLEKELAQRPPLRRSQRKLST
jgi:chromosome segregation ATPase